MNNYCRHVNNLPTKLIRFISTNSRLSLVRENNQIILIMKKIIRKASVKVNNNINQSPFIRLSRFSIEKFFN
jgi:hypothetical protein